MKKLLLSLFAALTGSLFAFAQGGIETDVTGDTMIYYIDTSANDFFEHIPVRNPSSVDLSLRFKKKVISAEAGTDLLFCTDQNCYPPTTAVSTVSVSLNSGGEYTGFKHQYTYRHSVGTSIVRYTIYDPSLIEDSIFVLVKYVVTTDGMATGPIKDGPYVKFSSTLGLGKKLTNTTTFDVIQKNEALFISTPSNNLNSYDLSLLDLTGTTVYHSKARGNQTIPVTNLNPGIYFVRMNDQTKKIFLK